MKNKCVLVLYDSQTGATEKLASEIARGLSSVEGIDIQTRHVSQATSCDVVSADGVIMGSPTHLGLLSWPLKRFWDEAMLPHWGKIDGKLGAVFSSQGGWAGGGELACQSMLTLLLNYGFLVFGVTDYVAKDFTLHYGALAAKEPRDLNSKTAAWLLGRRFAENIKRLK